jgi:hypothetical protein
MDHTLPGRDDGIWSEWQAKTNDEMNNQEQEQEQQQEQMSWPLEFYLTLMN